jgi:hypothetical protein
MSIGISFGMSILNKSDQALFLVINGDMATESWVKNCGRKRFHRQDQDDLLIGVYDDALIGTT